MTREEIVELLKIITPNFPHVKIADPEGLVTSWLLVFSEDKAEDIYMAARYYLTKGKFFPTAADIKGCKERGKLLYGTSQSSGPSIKAPEVPKLTASNLTYTEDNMQIVPDMDDVMDYIDNHWGEEWDGGKYLKQRHERG